MEGLLERREEARFQQHVVIEQADVGAAGARDAEVDGLGERERGQGVDHFDLRVIACQPFIGAVVAAVVDDDDLGGGLRQNPGELSLQQVSAGAGRDDHGDAGFLRASFACSKRSLTPRGPENSANHGGGVAGEQGPIGYTGGPHKMAQGVGGPPCDVARDVGKGRRPEHEVVEVFVESKETARRQYECQQAHAAERDVGDQHDAGEADGVAVHGLPAGAQVCGEGAVEAVGDPLEGGILGRKIGDHPDGQFGIDGAQVLDEAAVEVFGAA